jgi:hypothetical protein
MSCKAEVRYASIRAALESFCHFRGNLGLKPLNQILFIMAAWVVIGFDISS